MFTLVFMSHLYSFLLSLTLFFKYMWFVLSPYIFCSSSFFFLVLFLVLLLSSLFQIFMVVAVFILSPLLLELDNPCFVDSPHCWILLGRFINILFWACGIFFLHFITNVDIFAFSSSLLDFFINIFVDTQLTYT